MKKLISGLLLAFFFITNGLFSQELCFKIDSILVYSIPLETTSLIHIDKQEIKRLDSLSYNIKDSISLNKFTEFDLLKTSFYNKNKSIDTRVLVDVYTSSFGNIISIQLNKKGQYLIGNNYSYENLDLLNWINHVVPDVGFNLHGFFDENPHLDKWR